MKRTDVAQYTFIVYRLGKMGVSQASLAARLGITPAYINMVIQGKRSSADVQEKLAKEIGFSSWSAMRNAVSDFEARLCGTEVSHA